MEDSQKKKNKKKNELLGVSSVVYSVYFLLTSPRCHKRLPMRRLEVASR